MGLRLPAAAASMSERRGFRCWRCSTAARSPGSRIAGSSSSRGGSRRMSDVEAPAGVLPERVRHAPSGGEAPPPDNLRGNPTPDAVAALGDAHLLALAGTYDAPDSGGPSPADELRS